jgi:hypothetical protein
MSGGSENARTSSKAITRPRTISEGYRNWKEEAGSPEEPRLPWQFLSGRPSTLVLANRVHVPNLELTIHFPRTGSVRHRESDSSCALCK